MMRLKLIVAILIFHSMLLLAQDEKAFFLETDSTWRKEIFHFPISFAPDIDFEGVEDARFPIGWEKQDSPNFWSYAFAWNITTDEALTGKELELNVQKYFDGLMGVKDKMGKVEGVEKSIALFIKQNSEAASDRYVGKVRTFDAFFTKTPMTLNVLVSQRYYEDEKRLIILFKFSPQDFSSEAWETLKEVELPE